MLKAPPLKSSDLHFSVKKCHCQTYDNNIGPKSKGHSLSDFRAMVIEKVIPNDGAWLLEREEMWIRRLGTKKPHGLNRID